MKTKTRLQDSKQTSRRQFAKSIAASLLTAPLAASITRAQTTPKPKEAAAPPSPQPTPQQQPLTPLAEAYTEVARLRFGERLTPEQLEQIKKDLDGYVRKNGTADRLRAFKLKNADEPDFIYSAG